MVGDADDRFDDLSIGDIVKQVTDELEVINQSTGLISVFAEGPNNTRDTYWVTAGQPWSCPLAIGGSGTTYSVPTAVINQSTGLISAFAEGASNILDDCWVAAGQPWSGPLAIGGPGSTFW